MCFSVSSKINKKEVQTRFKVIISSETKIPDFNFVLGFTHPQLPVITQTQPDTLQLMEWGLIPHWCPDEKKADELRDVTLNAKSETIFEKPSFRESIVSRRCLVLVDGFFEWQTVNGKKFPYYIYLKNHVMFTIAGVYDTWVNKSTGLSKDTFTLITTAANPLVAKIHNLKKRMPVILPPEKESLWIQKLDKTQVQDFMQPLDDKFMAAHTVSRLVSTRKGNVNVPTAQVPYSYPELKD